MSPATASMTTRLTAERTCAPAACHGDRLPCVFDFADGDRSRSTCWGQGSQPRRNDEPGARTARVSITTKACRHHLARGKESQSCRGREQVRGLAPR